MRDFTNGGDMSVGGDIVITDQSRQHELLMHCDNEFLVAEERFRCSQLARERADKYKRIALTVAFVACFIFAIGIYHWFTGRMESFELLAKIAPFVLGDVSIVSLMMPTEVEQRHINALREIQILLRERGVR